MSRRARQVPAAYQTKCRRLDQELGLQDEGLAGPFERRLNAWPEVVPLVVGAYGETNEEFLDLVRCLARAGAAKQMRHLRAPHEAAARGCFGCIDAD